MFMNYVFVYYYYFFHFFSYVPSVNLLLIFPAVDLFP